MKTYLGLVLLVVMVPAVARADLDPLRAFAPLALPGPMGPTRTAAGMPGAGYWQNRADYRISAHIDPASHVLSGDETITYANNSPDSLDALWLNVEQNIYRRDARSAAMPQFRAKAADQYTDGDVIDAVSVRQDGDDVPVTWLVSDTRLRLQLADPLAAGGKLSIHITWHYTVPGDPWGGRTAVSATPDGPMYEIAQWYPRMAVYDDLRGWDTLPYLGSGEFYCEYGDFDVRVTVPNGWHVASSGTLENPGEVLSSDEQDRLEQARQSETTVHIRRAEDVTAAPASGEATWRFKLANARDFVFAASPAFLWDAARIDLPGGGHALAEAVYPRASAGDAKWGRAVEYAKGAIEYFSSTWAAYPWPSMTVVGGHGAEMEYPAMTFQDKLDAGKDLFWITAHETGHSWFPMLVGSNERRYAFMDEGFNTFIDVGASDAFNHGEYAPKRDVEYAPGGGNPADEMAPWLADGAAPPIMTAADLVSEKYRHSMEYFKPAFGMVLLRDVILGPARFDAAFRRYIAMWSYKHPAPADFFRLMDSEAGEDLSWFWRGWYYQNLPVDMTLDSAGYAGSGPGNGVTVSVTAHTNLPLPATIEAHLADGTSVRMTLPVEAFFRGAQAHFTLPTQGIVTEVVLDPDHVLPLASRAHDSVAVHEAGH